MANRSNCYLPSFGALAREFGKNHRLLRVLLLVLLAARLHEERVRCHAAARLVVLGAAAAFDGRAADDHTAAGRLHLYVLVVVVVLLMVDDMLLVVLLQVLVLWKMTQTIHRDQEMAEWYFSERFYIIFRTLEVL